MVRCLRVFKEGSYRRTYKIIMCVYCETLKDIIKKQGCLVLKLTRGKGTHYKEFTCWRRLNFCLYCGAKINPQLIFSKEEMKKIRSAGKPCKDCPDRNKGNEKDKN